MSNMTEKGIIVFLNQGHTFAYADVQNYSYLRSLSFLLQVFNNIPGRISAERFLIFVYPEAQVSHWDLAGDLLQLLPHLHCWNQLNIVTWLWK